MLSILIIDDTKDKVNELRNFILRKFPEIKSQDIEDVNCTNMAQKRLKTKYYDLLLLDLNIPRFQNSQASPKVAKEFLDVLNEGDLVKQPAHILGITQMKDVPDEFKTTFDDNLWSLLYYGMDYSGWEHKLEQKLQYLITSKSRLLENPTYNYDVAIITALQYPEFSELKKVFGDKEFEEVRVPYDLCNSYYCFTTKSVGGGTVRVIVAYQSQMASITSAALTAKMLYHFRPRYVFMTGIAAAVKKTGVNYGDVLVPSRIWDGASGKYNKNGTFEPDTNHIALEPSFETIINRMNDNHQVLEEIRNNSVFAQEKELPPISIHLKPMASVPAVIADKDKLNIIKLHSRKLAGIEMEAYGMFWAATHSVEPRPQIIAALKSVSDYADKKKTDEYQEYAAYTSAACLRYIIENELSY